MLMKNQVHILLFLIQIGFLNHTAYSQDQKTV